MIRDHLRERGVWVTIVGEKKPEPIEGWLIGEIPQGLLIALDEELTNIRLVVRESGWVSVSYDHKRVLAKLAYEDAGELQKRLHETDAAISRKLRGALSRVKYDELQKFSHISAQVAAEIREAQWQYRNGPIESPRNDLMRYLLAQADRSTSLHDEIYDMLENSGVGDLLNEFGPELSGLPPELTIPAYDLEFQSREELVETLESTREEHWTTSKHRASLEAAKETRTKVIIDATQWLERADEPKENPDDSTAFSRWVGPSLRILAGTGLTAANAAIGITAGLTTTIATIGATAVPTYVGVATSLYTGLAQVSDGLEKIGRRK